MQKSKKFKHVIATRFNNSVYDNAEELLTKFNMTVSEWMNERFELFKDTKHSVLSQEGEFQWVISFDHRTPPDYIKECCSDPRMVYTFKDLREYKYVSSEPFVITSRIDNDDMYCPGFVKAVQAEFAPQVMVIDIDYYQKAGNKYYTSERYTANSPFVSLVEPSSRVKSVYCRPHTKLPDGYPMEDGSLKSIPAVKIRRQLAFMNIHGHNLANKIVGKEIK
jgi:hypothetical protein